MRKGRGWGEKDSPAVNPKHSTELNTRAKRLRMRKVYFQIGDCECELHNKNACFELKSNFISIQNFKAGNVKPPGMHWSKDF